MIEMQFCDADNRRRVGNTFNRRANCSQSNCFVYLIDCGVTFLHFTTEFFTAAFPHPERMRILFLCKIKITAINYLINREVQFNKQFYIINRVRLGSYTSFKPHPLMIFSFIYRTNDKTYGVYNKIYESYVQYE